MRRPSRRLALAAAFLSLAAAAPDLQRQLVDACGRDDIKAAEALLAQGALANGTSVTGVLAMPPVLIAALETLDDAETIAFLVRRGADPNGSHPQTGERPLHTAARRGKERFVAELLRLGARINGTRLNGETALHVAAREGHEDVVKQLLAAGIDRNRRTIPGGKTAVQIALEHGRADIAERLGNRAAIPKVRRELAQALAAAAEQGNEEAIDVLLDQGAPPDSPDPTGRTPLARACAKGRLDAVKALVARGALPYGPPEQHANSLALAAMSGNLELVEWLFDREGRLPTDADEALAAAAAVGNVPVLRWLLEHGAKTESLSAGRTPLVHATLRGQAAAVRLLLAAGARTDVKDKDGRSAVDWARAKGNRPILKQLLRRR